MSGKPENQDGGRSEKMIDPVPTAFVMAFIGILITLAGGWALAQFWKPLAVIWGIVMIAIILVETMAYISNISERNTRIRRDVYEDREDTCGSK